MGEGAPKTTVETIDKVAIQAELDRVNKVLNRVPEGDREDFELYRDALVDNQPIDTEMTDRLKDIEMDLAQQENDNSKVNSASVVTKDLSALGKAVEESGMTLTEDKSTDAVEIVGAETDEMIESTDSNESVDWSEKFDAMSVSEILREREGRSWLADQVDTIEMDIEDVVLDKYASKEEAKAKNERVKLFYKAIKEFRKDVKFIRSIVDGGGNLSEVLLGSAGRQYNLLNVRYQKLYEQLSGDEENVSDEVDQSKEEEESEVEAAEVVRSQSIETEEGIKKEEEIEVSDQEWVKVTKQVEKIDDDALSAYYSGDLSSFFEVEDSGFKQMKEYKIINESIKHALFAAVLPKISTKLEPEKRSAKAVGVVRAVFNSYKLYELKDVNEVFKTVRDELDENLSHPKLDEVLSDFTERFKLAVADVVLMKTAQQKRKARKVAATSKDEVEDSADKVTNVSDDIDSVKKGDKKSVKKNSKDKKDDVGADKKASTEAVAAAGNPLASILSGL